MPDVPDDELKALRKSAALYDALSTRLPDLERAATRVGELEGELATFKAQQLEATWTGAKITDPKVRRIFEMDFTEQAAVEGGEKDLGKWLAGVAADPSKAPAHLVPFLPKADAGAGARPAGTPGPNARNLPDTSAGAKPPQVGGGITAEQINAMSSAEFASALPGLAKQFPALAALPPLPGTTVPAAPGTNQA